MAVSATASAVWDLNDCHARLTLGHVEGSINIARPDEGLHVPALDVGSFRCALFCTYRTNETEMLSKSGGRDAADVWPLAVEEAYVRGNDLVATYGATEDWPYAPQLYWRAGALDSVEHSLASVSQIISVQTHLLDTYPRIHVASNLQTQEAFIVTIKENGTSHIEPVSRRQRVTPRDVTCCVLWRLPSASYAEIVPANDVRAIDIERSPHGGWLAKWHLFAEFLEKGVIRRARIHGVLLPRLHDIELALECCLAAENTPLPLTV